MEPVKATTQARITPIPSHSERGMESGIVTYSNRIQGFAYGGAAVLVVIIGLRSVYGRAIPSWIVISGLLLEAFLLLMIATVYYLTPEEKGGGQPSTNSLLLNGEKEILSLLRNNVLQGESEILNVLKNDLLSTQKEMVSVMRNELLAAQKEIASALRKEIETRAEHQQQLASTLHQDRESRIHQQEELLQSLRSSTEATQQQLKSLGHIDEQITMLLKNEVDNIVQAKVQEILSGVIRREAERRIEQRLGT